MRAKCLMCPHNTPSQPKEPSMVVPITNYAFESLSVDLKKKKKDLVLSYCQPSQFNAVSTLN